METLNQPGEEYSAYDEYLTYDKNGNILTLNRMGKIQMDTNPIDELAYVYKGNQLIKKTRSPKSSNLK